MGNKWVINVLLVIIMILVVVACVVAYMCFTNDVEIIQQKEETILFSQENYPKIDGSTATLPLAEAFKANFTGTAISEVKVEHSKTHNAYVNLINGDTDLILVTYPSEDELELAKQKGIELEIIPIVKEAFVFFVNKENPVENLTLSQIQNIYSGNIKKIFLNNIYHLQRCISTPISKISPLQTKIMILTRNMPKMLTYFHSIKTNKNNEIISFQSYSPSIYRSRCVLNYQRHMFLNRLDKENKNADKINVLYHLNERETGIE